MLRASSSCQVGTTRIVRLVLAFRSVQTMLGSAGPKDAQLKVVDAYRPKSLCLGWRPWSSWLGSPASLGSPSAWPRTTQPWRCSNHSSPPQTWRRSWRQTSRSSCKAPRLWTRSCGRSARKGACATDWTGRRTSSAWHTLAEWARRKATPAAVALTLVHPSNKSCTPGRRWFWGDTWCT